MKVCTYSILLSAQRVQPLGSKRAAKRLNGRQRLSGQAALSSFKQRCMQGRKLFLAQVSQDLILHLFHHHISKCYTV